MRLFRARLLTRDQRDYSFALGDVPRNRGYADDIAGAVPDRRDRERDIEQCAIFPPASRFVMFDSIAAAYPLQNARLFIDAFGWHEDRDGALDNFVIGVAEYSLRRGVPGCDIAVEIFGEDRVVGRRDDGGEHVADGTCGVFAVRNKVSCLVPDRNIFYTTSLSR